MRKRKHESGQTLIAAVIVLVIILLAIILLFDVQNLIRGKVKAQNAVDAAALTGANWQMHTLNLIGELNLVKASTLMISDSALGIAMPPENFTAVKPPEEIQSKEQLLEEIRRVEAEKAKLKKAVALLTQMQTRISFVGPLIGVGAAQQAAKNNGISANKASGDLIYKHMYKNIEDPAFYGNPNIAPQIINDYEWRLPYAAMIYKILGVEGDGVYGLAACPRFNYIGVPTLASNNNNPLLPYLTRKNFYAAVNGNDWCELMSFLDQPYQDNWWSGFECDYKTHFLEEAEILPVHLEYTTGAAPYDQAESANVLNLLFLRHSQLRPLNSAFDRKDPYAYTVDPNTNEIHLKTEFDSEGRPVRNPEDTDLRYNYLPYIKWAVYDSQWEKYSPDVISAWRRYLHSGFKPGMDYYCGAPSYFEIAQTASTMIGQMNISSSMKHVGSSRSGLGRTLKNRAATADSAGRNLKNLSSSLKANASAKVIGRIAFQDGTAIAPFEAGGMILPVFSHTALLPISLEPPVGFSFLDVGWYYYITEFIPLLGQSSSLEEAWKLAQEQYPDHISYFNYYYQALKKINDPTWIQAGKKWLDTPVTYYTDEHGVRHVLQRNRDFCNYWPSGGSGGDRRGPGSLH
ncbi:MAG: Tad domain-containing protein [Lentisphaeria bacterium]|nr:Tad domain-containing protein [Lentisphaeria bacterium]